MTLLDHAAHAGGPTIHVDNCTQLSIATHIHLPTYPKGHVDIHILRIQRKKIQKLGLFTKADTVLIILRKAAGAY